MSSNPLRRRLFAHLNGLVFAPIAYALHGHGVTTCLLSRKEASLPELQARFHANAGYLNVALRCAASMGYLQYIVDGADGEVRVQATRRGAAAFPLFELYAPLVPFQHLAARPAGFFRKPVLDMLGPLIDHLLPGRTGPPAGSEDAQRERDEILLHIQGGIAGPLLVHMGMAGAFADLDRGVNPECFGGHPAAGKVMEFFSRLGWIRSGTQLLPTEAGRFFFGKAASYGVPVSYLPMLTCADELIFGDPDVLARHSAADEERHVDRRMNVWGSGNTHGSYFTALADAVVELFDRPIELQPAGIVDVGCGDGALLALLHRVVIERTRRGRMLEQHPLRLFGVDYNAAALEVTRTRLARAAVPATLLWGDVGRPDLLADTLKQDHAIDLGDLLNVRTFLDHNRPWVAPTKPSSLTRISTGAFAHRGARLAPRDVESSLTEHLRRWTPYVQRHGLLLVELHTIDPELAARHVGATLAPAYDATHGFSDQYILELGAFERAAAAAGLYADTAVGLRFPDSELATVSVNLLRERRRWKR